MTEKIPDQTWRAVKEAAAPDEVVRYLSDELFKASGLGADSFWQQCLDPIISPLIRRFTRQAGIFDQRAATLGFAEAARQQLAAWQQAWVHEGKSNLPAQGPLLIAANHPGTFDGLAVVAALQRNDIKVVTAANPFFRALPNMRHYFIFSTRDAFVRLATFRNALRHLQNGGALLIFPSGKLDPDPFYFREAAFQSMKNWSKSLEALLRKAPETRLVVAINTGFVAPQYMRHPLARLQRDDSARQKLAEFLQVIQQVILSSQSNDL